MIIDLIIMECRICFGDESEGRLISPCLCKGSMKYVHADCLDTWRHSSTNAFYECNQCKYKYVFQYTWISYLLQSFLVHSLCTGFLSILLCYGTGYLLCIFQKQSIAYQMSVGLMAISFVGSISMAHVIIEEMNHLRLRNDGAFATIIMFIGVCYVMYRIYLFVVLVTSYFVTNVPIKEHV
jgi:RING-variant domain